MSADCSPSQCVRLALGPTETGGRPCNDGVYAVGVRGVRLSPCAAADASYAAEFAPLGQGRVYRARAADADPVHPWRYLWHSSAAAGGWVLGACRNLLFSTVCPTHIRNRRGCSGCRRRRPALLRRRPTPLLHRRRGRGRWPAAGELALGAELRGVPRPLAKARDGPPLAGLRALLSARRRAAASGRGRAGRIFPLRRPRLLHLHRLQLAAAAAATVATRRAASLRVRLAGGRDRHRGGRPGVDRDGRGAVGGPLCARERPAAGVDLPYARGSARGRRWRSGDRLPPPLHHHHPGSRLFCARERREAGRRSSSPPCVSPLRRCGPSLPTSGQSRRAPRASTRAGTAWVRPSPPPSPPRRSTRAAPRSSRSPHRQLAPATPHLCCAAAPPRRTLGSRTCGRGALVPRRAGSRRAALHRGTRGWLAGCGRCSQ